MVKVANVEGLVARKTGKNSRIWYYRLAVPLRDQKRAACKEIWQSLRTSDKATAIDRLPAAIERAKSKLAKKLTIGPLKIETCEVAITAPKPDDIARLSVKLAALYARLALFA
jgi:uncharacterized protein DUF6538